MLVNTTLQPIFSVNTVDIEIAEATDDHEESNSSNEQSIKSLDFVSQSTQDNRLDNNNQSYAIPETSFQIIVCERYVSPFCESTKRHLKKLFSRIISRNAP